MTPPFPAIHRAANEHAAEVVDEARHLTDRADDLLAAIDALCALRTPEPEHPTPRAA